MSDCLRHDAAGVRALLTPVFDNMKDVIPSVEVIHFQSDGSTTQYKNKFHFYLFNYFCTKLNLKSASWNYSAACHGKSVADGIGGTTKELCDRHVACGNNILCARDMVDLINLSNCKVNAYLVAEDSITAIDAIIPEKLEIIQGTLNVQQLVWSHLNKDTLSFRNLSCSSCYLNFDFYHYTIRNNIVYNDDKNHLRYPI